MSKPYLNDIIKQQLDSFEHATLTIPPSTKYEDFTLDDAYLVAAQLHKWRCANGQNSTGRKIGFTNQTIWEDHGLNTPIWAHIYEESVEFATDNAASVFLSDMALPRIEPEIVFKLKATPIPTDAEPAEILKQIEWVALGFEIVDAHYADWQFSPADAVADFGVHAALLIGTPMKIDGPETQLLAKQLETFQVALSKNGNVEAEGVGKNVLGHPALALSYLQDVLNQQAEAAPLTPGEIITTGTLTTAISVSPGEKWSAEVNGIDLPTLNITFTD